MNTHIDLLKGKVIYLVVTAASKIKYTSEVVNGLTKLGARVLIISTPNSRDILNKLDLEESAVKDSVSQFSDVNVVDEIVYFDSKSDPKYLSNLTTMVVAWLNYQRACRIYHILNPYNDPDH